MAVTATDTEAGTEHGDDCPGCRRIDLVCIGPDFTPGAVSWIPCEQDDICRTLGAILHVPTPLAGGRVLAELLSSTTDVASPAGTRATSI